MPSLIMPWRSLERQEKKWRIKGETGANVPILSRNSRWYIEKTRTSGEAEEEPVRKFLFAIENGRTAVSKISGRSVIPPVMETKRSSRAEGIVSSEFSRAEAKHFSRMSSVRLLRLSYHDLAILIFRSVVEPIPWGKLTTNRFS